MSTFGLTPSPFRPPGQLSPATAALLVSLLLGACSDSTGPGPQPPPVGAVALEASRTELEITEAVQIIATVLDTSGVVLQGRSVTWSSSDDTVISVTVGGLATAVGPGLATVSATSGGVSGELSFTVSAGGCRAAVARPTTPGQTHDGEITTFDCVFPGGHFADGWVLTLSERTAIEFTMTSNDLDAFLLATDTLVTTGVAFDDDTGGGTDARMLHVFDPGTYLVWATSFSGQTGTYRLSSEVVEVASCDTPVGSLPLNGSVTHALTTRSCVRGSAISDPWSLSLSEDAQLHVSLSSSNFDTTLEITDAQGQHVAFDDDGGVGINSLIQVSLTSGDYTVWVSSFSGLQTGAYTLTVGSASHPSLFHQAPQDVGINYATPHYADDFLLPLSATLQEFRWWGSSGAGVTTAVRLFADDGTGNPQVEPFFEVLSPAVHSTSSSVIPRAQSLPVYENRVTLSDAPVLQAGTRYYISISGPSSWLSSTAPGSEWWSRALETDTWSNASTTNPNNLAFQLLGVPEG